MDLHTKVIEAGRNYKMYAGRLARLGIFTLEDFLFHIPFRYEDFSIISKIEQIQAGETVTVRGKIKKIENNYTKKWKSLQKALVGDDTGEIDIIWFNQPYIAKTLKVGDDVSLSGKVSLDNRRLRMIAPDFEIIFNNETVHTGRLVPIYPETRGLSSKWIRRQIYKILKEMGKIEDPLPNEIINANNLVPLSEALSNIHFPSSIKKAEEARNRLAFDEMFKIHLNSIERKITWKKEKNSPWKINKKRVDEFVLSLPFALTKGQETAVSEILNDLSSETSMNRLLEGDVGSGKTVVAAVAMYVAYLNGFQAAFMAPTEILTNQHYKTLKELFKNLNINLSLFTSSSKSSSDFDIAIGTQALIYKSAKFKNLGLIIIDEQQRFGVEQRAKLRAKGKNPHLLTMTATPIPRTVALTMYGDLDLSVLDEMPKGRQKIKTWLVPPSKRESAYKWIETKIRNEKAQVFIVCPLIEESENLTTVKAAKKEFEHLSTDVFPSLKLGLLHGKLKPKEKEEVLAKFKSKEIDILVATPVVEVGIDIPSATVMLIEEADRFGLAQLHQLRGRVGRGNTQSFCLLFTSSTNPVTLKRLKAMETIYSGPQLAELDLKLRGPGQIYGTMQHGVPKLKVANFSDLEMIQKTKVAAEKIFKDISNYPSLKTILLQGHKNISPD